MVLGVLVRCLEDRFCGYNIVIVNSRREDVK